MPRNDESTTHPVKPALHQKTMTLRDHVTLAAATTLSTHPLRVILNRASYHTSPLATLRDSYGYLFKGASINILRGSLATGCQSHIKHYTQSYFNQQPVLGLLVSLIAASIAGATVATFVEVPFMRKTEMLPSYPHGFMPSYFRINRPIALFFFGREFGFSGAVLGAKDLSPRAHDAVLLSAAWATASCHKLAMIEATKDLKVIKYTVPDYQQGMVQVFRHLANGNYYTHPAIQSPILQPKNLVQKSANVLYATCGPNMFLWRLTYLTAFSKLYSFFKHRSIHPAEPAVPAPNHKIG